MKPASPETAAATKNQITEAKIAADMFAAPKLAWMRDMTGTPHPTREPVSMEREFSNDKDREEYQNRPFTRKPNINAK